MKKLYVLIILSCLYGVTAVTADETAPGIRMMYTAQSGYRPDELQILSRMFTELSGIGVEIDHVDYGEQYQRIVQTAAEYDVISLDQLWLMDLIEQELIDPLDGGITPKMRGDLSPRILGNFRYQKKTWAFPFLLNVQMFFYNKKLLKGTLLAPKNTSSSKSTEKKTSTTKSSAPEVGFKNPPKTLEEMVSQMRDLKKAGVVEYPWTDAWQQGEGLVSEYAWLTGAFGGELFDEDGLPVFDQEPGVNALDFMMMLLQEKLANPDILTYDEITAKNLFMEGKAVFTTNWLFQEGFLNENSDESEIAMGMIPASKSAEKKSVSVSSMQGLAITSASQQKEAAWLWIKFLTSPLVQRAYRFEMPIWLSVQTSDDMSILLPSLALKVKQLENAQRRPKLTDYADISNILQQHLFTALKTSLQEQVVALDVLTQAKKEIETLQKKRADQ